MLATVDPYFNVHIYIIINDISYLQVFKIRRMIKSLQEFKEQLPFLITEIIKEVEFIARNYKNPDAYKRCKEVH